MSLPGINPLQLPKGMDFSIERNRMSLSRIPTHRLQAAPNQGAIHSHRRKKRKKKRRALVAMVNLLTPRCTHHEFRLPINPLSILHVEVLCVQS